MSLLGESCRLRNATSVQQLLLPNHWGPLSVTSPESPMFPVLKASTKRVMMHFLQGTAVRSVKLLRLQNLQFYWICDQKTDGFFALQSKINSTMMNCIFGCSASTQNVRIVLPEIVPTICVDKGMLFHWHSKVYSTAHNKPPSLILQAVVVKPLSNYGSMLKARSLDSCYDSVPSPKQALADLLRQN